MKRPPLLRAGAGAHAAFPDTCGGARSATTTPTLMSNGGSPRLGRGQTVGPPECDSGRHAGGRDDGASASKPGNIAADGRDAGCRCGRHAQLRRRGPDRVVRLPLPVPEDQPRRLRAGRRGLLELAKRHSPRPRVMALTDALALRGVHTTAGTPRRASSPGRPIAPSGRDCARGWLALDNDRAISERGREIEGAVGKDRRRTHRRRARAADCNQRATDSGVKAVGDTVV
jgi:hypothetical protein